MDNLNLNSMKLFSSTSQTEGSNLNQISNQTSSFDRLAERSLEVCKLNHENEVEINLDRSNSENRKNQVLISISDNLLREGLNNYFKEHGFSVTFTPKGDEIRKIVREEKPHVTIISVDGRSLESGWLICKKLRMENPDAKIVLLGSKPSAKFERFANFLGGIYLSTVSSYQIIGQIALGKTHKDRDKTLIGNTSL